MIEYGKAISFRLAKSDDEWIRAKAIALQCKPSVIVRLAIKEMREGQEFKRTRRRRK